jgi:hypothetical protein
MPQKTKKSGLTNDQKKAVKDARNVMVRASREARGILSAARVGPFLLLCRYGRPHCASFLTPAQPGGGCKRPGCSHPLVYHLPRR